MTIYSVYSLEKGRRKYMEDNVFLFNNRDINFTSVFDGHGGKKCSLYLKYNIYNYFINEYKNYDKTYKSIYITYKKLNNNFLQKGISSGSTCNTLIINKKAKQFYLANIGDSRCIAYYKNNKIRQISRDHKPTISKETNFIRKRGGYVKNGRVNGILAMSRSIGDKNLEKYLNYEPEIYYGDLNKVFYFVQASDGLFDVMTNREICQFINNLYQKRIPKKEIVKKLIKYAIYYRQSQDNISVIITFV
jgi:serine/threonine protein phosphatase PrpC